MFGTWTENLDSLSYEYKHSKPVEHIVISNFFKDPDSITIPNPDSSWYVYDNPFEGKFLKNNFDDLPDLQNTIDELYSDTFLEYVSKITGIDNIEKDPYLNAGGLHSYTKNGRSGIHLDYTIHPITGKERRVSIMVYMTKNWKEEWGGKLRIWDENFENETTINHGMWNSAIIFRTNGMAYHGFPEPLKCPENEYRNVIGIYYMSDPTSDTLKNPRYCAHYFPKPGQYVCDKLHKLYDIRKNRRINDEDLNDWPTWRQDCGLV